LKCPGDLRAELGQLYLRRQRDWLRSETAPNPENVQTWPLKVNLNVPSEQVALRDVANVRQWVDAWRHWNYAGSIAWRVRQWSRLGHNEVPESISFEGPSDIATIVGKGDEWARVRNRAMMLVLRWPQLHLHIARVFQTLAGSPEPEFERLLLLLSWLWQNPNSQVYPRQVPVAGLDSKWIEKNQSVLKILVRAFRDQSCGASPDANGDFYQVCGLRSLPRLVRVRLLDPKSRADIGGLDDIQAPLEQVATLGLKPRLVVIVENLQTGLAFTELPGAVVVMGLGYSVDCLASIRWLGGTRCLYWGDLDTHGLAILNRARSYLPDLESVLMDEETLLGSKELWGEERIQHAAEDLPLLKPHEREVYRGLKQNRWGLNVRLEQERIAWNRAWEVLLSSAAI
jgi:hypothetical protein